MQCGKHNEKEAVAVCVSCGKALCDECDSLVQEKHYCEKCREEILDDSSIIENRGIHGFLWFIFSLIPGAGHMYMGLMKRGAILLGLFLAIVVLDNIIFGWTFVGAISVLIYVYAFFDSLNTKRAFQRGEVVADEGFENISLEKVNLYYVGIAIIVLGVLSLIQINLNIFNFLPIVRSIFYALQRSLLPILLIAVGLWLIKRSKAGKELEEE